MLNSDDISLAYDNIKNEVIKTPIITSSTLNQMLGHEIFFKLENLQKTGSYKIRGCLNTFISLAKKDNLPKKVTAYSTGNHGIALAYAARKHNIPVDLYLPFYTSKIKQSIAKKYGANIILTSSREKAEQLSRDASSHRKDVFHIPPSDLKEIIYGAGTAVYESLLQEPEFDSIFVPIGGGGLASGSYLAIKHLNKKTKIFLAEPTLANDVATSLKSNKIFRFDHSPKTIADGARTLGISDNIFSYVKKCAGIFEIPENEIIYWTSWFIHLTKYVCEPTSALALAAANRWLKEKKSKKKVLVVITGGNLDNSTYRKIWKTNNFNTPPNLFIYK